MAEVGEISVVIGADTRPLEAGMGRARSELDSIKRFASTAATSIAQVGAAATAAATAVVGLTRVAAQNARELENMARISNTTTQEFQRLAFGARTVGVEQQTLADIFRDTQDRIGDFLQTGGGELADFFDNIAPQIGITAQEMARMSGPQALQAIYNGLQQTNLSAAETTFYMEALASDASELVPLLRDGGAGFAEMSRQANELGIILSDIDIARLQDFNRQFERLTGIMAGLGNVLATEIAPYLSVVIERITDMATEGDGFRESMSSAIRATITSLGPLLDALHGIRIVLAGMRAFAFSIGQAYTTVFAEITSAVTGALDFIAGGLNTLIEQVNRLPGVTDIALIDSFSDSDYMRGVEGARDRIGNLAGEARAELMELVNAPMPSGSIEQFLNDVDERVQEFKKRFQENGGLFTPPGGGGGSSTGTSGSTDQQDGAGSFAGGIGIFGEGEQGAFIERLREQQEMRQEILREYDELDVERQQEKFEADLERLREARDLEAITEEEYRQAALERERKFAAEKYGIRADSESGITALVGDAQSRQASMYAASFDSILGSLATFSETAFKIQKGLAIANAVVKGYEAVVGAYAWGSNIGGPPLGAAMAAAAGAATFAQIQAIRSQQFSSGSSGGGGGSAASAGGGSSAGAGQGQQAQQQAPTETLVANLSVQGEVFDRRTVIGLIDQINSLQDDGMRVVVRTD